jgi:flavin-dependent dehydrogenase
MIGQELGDVGPVSRQRVDSMMTFIEAEAPDVTENFRGHIIDRALFDRRLIAAAVDAGADCRLATQVESLAADGTARLSDGREIRPRLIIAADGPRSRVGRAIGARNRALVETRQVTVPLRIAHQATDIFLSAEIPGGYGWLFPKGDVANLGLGVAPPWKSRLKPLLESLHRGLVAQGRVGAEVLGYTGGAIPVGGMLRLDGRLGAVPVLLTGDAGGLTNPVTGAGISAAVISGGSAGQAAADWLAGDGQAVSDYREDMEELFTGGLDRALERRREILASYRAGPGPSAAALRRGWIAFPEYWAA